MYLCVCVTCVKGDQVPYISRLDNLAKPKDAPRAKRATREVFSGAQYGMNNLVSPNKKKQTIYVQCSLYS